MAFSQPNRQAPPPPVHVDGGVDAAERLIVSVKKVLFSDPKSGFFIAEAQAVGQIKAPEGALRINRSGEETLILKGESPSFAESPVLEQGLEVAGSWAEDQRGAFFQVLYTQETIPTTPEALRKYLADGRLKGIGPSTANRLVDTFGLDLLRVLDSDPGKLATVQGLNQEKADRIGREWKEKREMFRVVAFLGLHGIGENLAKGVAKQMGMVELEERVRQRPYDLTQVDGIAFAKADRVALSLGVPHNDPMRIQAALVHVLQEAVDNAGDTAIPLPQWVEAAIGFVGESPSVIKEHCTALVKDRRVVLRKLPIKEIHNGQVVQRFQTCATPMRLGQQENFIAKALAAHMEISARRREAGMLPRATDRPAMERMRTKLSDPSRGLDPSQRQAAINSVNQPVSILTGGPGTGKTTTLRSLVRVFEEEGLEVVLAAPTGRAAKRMSEAIGRPAATIHRTLEAKGKLGFQRNEDNPLVGDVFILDEASMVDTMLMASWLRALPKNARLILVGDGDQLPSVDAGNVLSDLIESGKIPTSRLAVVHRNGGAIARAAQMIRSGQAPTHAGEPWVDTYAFVPTPDDEGIVENLERLIDGFVNKGYAHQDIQVLTPQNEGSIGTVGLNETLRWKLNPERPDPAQSSGAGFLKGERVMQTKNNYDLEVFNGDMGNIVEFEGDGCTVEMEDGRQVKYDKDAMKSLKMGYAITIHKSQGGERKVVLMVCAKRHTFSLSRNLIYTGITRGKEFVMVVGQPRSMLLGVRQLERHFRKTGLVTEIHREMSLLNPPAAPRRPHP